MPHGVIFLPGIVTPAQLAFGDLREALGSEHPIVLRELAIYDGDAPPEDYALDLEIAGVLATASKSGFVRFHLVGYSAGGAIAAAVASRYGGRLASLTLMEPAWLGNTGVSDKERRAFDAAIAAADLPAPEAMAQFVKLNLREGIEPPPPPPGDPPPWMASRPAAIRAIGPALREYDLDLDGLRRLDCPVIYALGTLSNPDLYEERANRASKLFTDFTLEVFEGRHHFDPPHRAEPERVASLMRAVWAQAERERSSSKSLS